MLTISVGSSAPISRLVISVCTFCRRCLRMRSISTPCSVRVRVWPMARRSLGIIGVCSNGQVFVCQLARPASLKSLSASSISDSSAAWSSGTLDVFIVTLPRHGSEYRRASCGPTRAAQAPSGVPKAEQPVFISRLVVKPPSITGSPGLINWAKAMPVSASAFCSPVVLLPVRARVKGI